MEISSLALLEFPSTLLLLYFVILIMMTKTLMERGALSPTPFFLNIICIMSNRDAGLTPGIESGSGGRRGAVPTDKLLYNMILLNFFCTPGS